MKKLNRVFALLLILMVTAAFTTEVSAVPIDKDDVIVTVNHVQYLLREVNGEKIAAVLRYAENDKISNEITEINILPEVDGYKVTKIYATSSTMDYQNVTNVSIPDTVEMIDYRAFYGMGKVKEITIPDSVKSIGESAFGQMSSLEKITLSSSLAEIGEAAFSNAERLQSITIPKGVTKIEEYTFDGCTNLKEVIFEGNISAIRERAFQNCEKLENIILPESLVSIGARAFSGCSKITGVELPDTLKFIDCAAFSGTSIESITIPSKTEMHCACSDEPGKGPFYNCKKLRTVIFEDADMSNRRETEIHIPQSTFENCVSLETVVLPSNGEKIVIANRAFKNCTKLKNIYHTENIYKIYDAAFAYCSALKAFTFSDNMLSETLFWLGDKAFYKCKNLRTVIFEGANSKEKEPLVEVSERCFEGCTNLQRVYLPEGNYVVKIGRRAFKNCSNLRVVYGTENIQKIEEAAFAYCSKLKSMSFSEKLKTVEAKAFLGCSKLSKITLENIKTAPEFGKNAFALTANGIRFVTDSNSAAKAVKKNLKNTGAKNAKVYKTTYTSVA